MSDGRTLSVFRGGNKGDGVSILLPLLASFPKESERDDDASSFYYPFPKSSDLGHYYSKQTSDDDGQQQQQLSRASKAASLRPFTSLGAADSAGQDTPLRGSARRIAGIAGAYGDSFESPTNSNGPPASACCSTHSRVSALLSCTPIDSHPAQASTPRSTDPFAYSEPHRQAASRPAGWIRAASVSIRTESTRRIEGHK